MVYLGKLPVLPAILLIVAAFCLNSLNSFPDAGSKIKYYAYLDPSNVNASQEIIIGDVKSLPGPVPGEEFRKWNSSVILVHGFGQTHLTAFPQITKNALLKRNYPANIIVVDWANVTSPTLAFVPFFNIGAGYPLAALQSESIGKEIADLIVFLTENGFQSDLSETYLIGFSLGAHISGFAGQHLKSTKGVLVNRITGLDPSGAIFQIHPIRERRLDFTDAKFVDIVHTDQVGYGYAGSSGHADFFPNGGGPNQPGCTLNPFESQDIPGLPLSCAHGRAYEYFTETILNKTVIACRALSYRQFVSRKDKCVEGEGAGVPFGVRTPPTARGNYYFDILRTENLVV